MAINTERHRCLTARADTKPGLSLEPNRAVRHVIAEQAGGMDREVLVIFPQFPFPYPNQRGGLFAKGATDAVGHYKRRAQPLCLVVHVAVASIHDEPQLL